MNTSEQVKRRSDRRARRLYLPLLAAILVAPPAVYLEAELMRSPVPISAAEPAADVSPPVRAKEAAPEKATVRSAKVHALAVYLSRRYRVAQEATQKLVGFAFDAGRKVGLDPLLILSVMAVESRFNPIAESQAGAKGLMQIIPSYHKDKLRGNAKRILDPMTNVFLGARILKEYIRRTGSLKAGLQFYNGALSDPEEQYAEQVMAVQRRLRRAIRGADGHPRV